MYEVTDKSTVFGFKTPHGHKTPHKYPSDGEDSQTTSFLGMTKSLYPTGRAFNLPEKGTLENLHKGINIGIIRVVEDSKNIIETAIPDNEKFTEEEASFLEFKFGLFVNPLTTLENRKKALLRKMSHPSNVPARQNPTFLEDQLRSAGFDVRIYENKFFENGQWVYKTPEDITAMSLVATQHANNLQHGGGVQHGSSGFLVIANSDKGDESYNVGGNLWATFFISGPDISTLANIPEEREKEFRELVLKLKPAHTVAYLLVKYI
ncbi:hypothetical protein [Flagellimonas nanhaiensis]|uniref:Uncharacterized protein n=1 Tax=Flagellimonas nanhaiensis TaxID=2292706 RepID=A0A371JL95_9FLAO|nr:hypothetical protein [Allomuricauda nanhaiensis]RDY57716.1 hypothetical protein DX873_17610 [Allomuricauda nanhaiensis]